MSKTWSSLPSDRIQVKKSGGSRTQQPAKTPPIAKSKAVLAIESAIDAFQSHPPSQKDPKGGCFCLARMHPLARPGARLCLSCGLVLCNLNPAYAACPSCSTPLLSPHARNDMIASLHAELEKTLADEERKREEDAHRIVAAAGAFPTLPTHKPTPKPPPQQHKVLSVDSKTKKVIVQTRSAVPTPSPSPGPASEPVEEEPLRIPPPSRPSAARRETQVNIWTNLCGDSAKYIPPEQPKKKNKRRQNVELLQES